MDTEIQKQIQKMREDLDTLSQTFYKNNFTAHQDFNKSCNFSSKLKIPIYTTLPLCEVGEICAYSNAGTYKLMIATAANVWTVAGSQS